MARLSAIIGRPQRGISLCWCVVVLAVAFSACRGVGESSPQEGIRTQPDDDGPTEGRIRAGAGRRTGESQTPRASTPTSPVPTPNTTKANPSNNISDAESLGLVARGPDFGLRLGKVELSAIAPLAGGGVLAISGFGKAFVLEFSPSVAGSVEIVDRTWEITSAMGYPVSLDDANLAWNARNHAILLEESSWDDDPVVSLATSTDDGDTWQVDTFDHDGCTDFVDLAYVSDVVTALSADNCTGDGDSHVWIAQAGTALEDRGSVGVTVDSNVQMCSTTSTAIHVTGRGPPYGEWGVRVSTDGLGWRELELPSEIREASTVPSVTCSLTRSAIVVSEVGAWMLGDETSVQPVDVPEGTAGLIIRAGQLLAYGADSVVFRSDGPETSWEPIAHSVTSSDVVVDGQGDIWALGEDVLTGETMLYSSASPRIECPEDHAVYRLASFRVWTDPEILDCDKAGELIDAYFKDPDAYADGVYVERWIGSWRCNVAALVGVCDHPDGGTVHFG